MVVRVYLSYSMTHNEQWQWQESRIEELYERDLKEVHRASGLVVWCDGVSEGRAVELFVALRSGKSVCLVLGNSNQAYTSRFIGGMLEKHREQLTMVGGEGSCQLEEHHGVVMWARQMVEALTRRQPWMRPHPLAGCPPSPPPQSPAGQKAADPLPEGEQGNGSG